MAATTSASTIMTTNMCTFSLAATNNTTPTPGANSAALSQIKSYKEIPGPKTVPVLGSLFNIKSFGGKYDFMEFRDFQNHLQADFGDLVKWEIFNYKFVCFSFYILFLFVFNILF